MAAEALETVNEMAAVVRERWLDRDEPPLWELTALEHSSSLWGEAREGYRYWTESVIEVMGERLERFLLALAVFVLALTLALLVRRLSQSWSADDAEIAVARFVVSRPVAAALAFSLVTLVYIVGELPGSVRDLAGVLAIFSVVPLGVGLLPSPAHPVLYGTASLYVFNRLWALVPDGSLLRRLLLLFVIACALAGALLLPEALAVPRNLEAERVVASPEGCHLSDGYISFSLSSRRAWRMVDARATSYVGDHR